MQNENDPLFTAMRRADRSPVEKLAAAAAAPMPPSAYHTTTNLPRAIPPAPAATKGPESVAAALTDNPKHAYGMAKPSISFIPMLPVMEVAEVMRGGAEKYGVRNWRLQPIKASVYYNAMWRHLMEWYENNTENAPDSGRHHLAHVIANAMIVMDAQKHGTLIDDRDYSEVIVK